MKPTKAELLAQTTRGGRVFLFEYPRNVPGQYGTGCHMPTYESQERIEEKLSDVPGCKMVEGPFVNGIMAITVDDTEEAGKLTDEQICERIASIIHRYWKER